MIAVLSTLQYRTVEIFCQLFKYSSLLQHHMGHFLVQRLDSILYVEDSMYSSPEDILSTEPSVPQNTIAHVENTIRFNLNQDCNNPKREMNSQVTW